MQVSALSFGPGLWDSQMAKYQSISALLMLSLLAGGCAQRLPTVDGPEATDLVKQVTGYIVMNGGADEQNRPEGLILAITLPNLKKEMVLKPPAVPSVDLPTLHALAGPDTEGRIACIEDHRFVISEKDKRHVLKSVKLDGTEEQELFVRRKAALWSDAIGEQLALAPVGGRIALVSDLTAVQMHEPPAYLRTGAIEIWDISKKTGRKVGVTALDDSLSWFPDGKRLAFVELVPAEKFARTTPEMGDFGAGFKKWEKIPVVHILDTDTGKKTRLHVGWQPVVSSNGETVLVQDFDNRLRMVTVAERVSKSIQLPGYWGRSIAVLERDLVLYWGLPTTGLSPGYTKHNSSLRGPKPMPSLKLAEINSGKFQTVMPYVDPRDRISFGKVEERR